MDQNAVKHLENRAGSIPEISLVIPMYNEESTIETTVAAHSETLDSLDVSWEMIVVDDGSIDGSRRIVEALCKKKGGLKLISYPGNRGRGYALRKGFACSKGNYIISIEADMSWGTAVISEIFGALKEGRGDMVIATPYLPGGGLEKVPLFRRLLSSLGNKILSFSLGGAVTMASGMTRGYNRKTLDSLDLESDDKSIHLEIISQVLTLGARVIEIPARLSWDKPGEDRSRRSSFRIWRFVISHLLFSFEEYPFMLFGGIGGILLILGTIFGFWALYLSLTGNPVGGRPVTLGSMLLILFGLQIIVFSFLSIQSRKLYKKMTRMTAMIKSLSKQDAGEKETK